MFLFVFISFLSGIIVAFLTGLIMSVEKAKGLPGGSLAAGLLVGLRATNTVPSNGWIIFGCAVAGLFGWILYVYLNKHNR